MEDLKCRVFSPSGTKRSIWADVPARLVPLTMLRTVLFAHASDSAAPSCLGPTLNS